MSGRLLTIGELARRAGVATSALRYWEELGLLPPAARIAGQRRYHESSAGLVGVILLLREVGFTLAVQKAFIASHAAAPGDWQRLAQRKLAELDDQIGHRRIVAALGVSAATVRGWLRRFCAAGGQRGRLARELASRAHDGPGKPATATSSGTRLPVSAAARRTPIACSSVATKMADMPGRSVNRRPAAL